MKIEIIELEEGFLPKKGSEGAGAYDVFARTSKYNKEKGFLEVMLGFKLAIPEGYVAKLFPRSSVTERGMMLGNSVGILDSDFRGEARARFYPNASSMMAINRPNTTLSDIIRYCENVFRNGEACAQLRIEQNVDVEWEKVEVLSSTERGEGAFGSTDKKKD